MNRNVSWGSLGMVCVGAVALVACGGAAAASAPEGDLVYCDIVGIACADWSVGADGKRTCYSATPAPILVSSPGFGNAVCVARNSLTAVDACHAACARLEANAPYSRAFYPKGAESCVGTVNSDPIHVYDPGQFVRNGCLVNAWSKDPTLTETHPTTNAVRLAATGTVSFDGSTQSADVISGYVDLSAPSTSCSSDQASCSVRVNQLELELADFSSSEKRFQGLTIHTRESFSTASGQFVASMNRFIFNIPSGITLDATANVDGLRSTWLTEIAAEEFGSLDPASGELALQYSIAGTFEGKAFKAEGTATTLQVLGRAPVVSAPPISVDATTSCSLSVPLQATVESPLGLSLFPEYFVDGAFVADASSTKVELSVGDHSAKVVAWDSLGEFASATQSITVSDKTTTGCDAQ